MTLQIRPPSGGMPYAPHRDLVNCFPAIARRAAYCLAPDAREPWFDDFLTQNGISDDDLGKAAVALAEYINQCRKPELEDPTKVLSSSGFLALPPPVQMAVLTKLAQVVMAMFYATSRDALRLDEKPLGLDALLSTVDRVRDILAGKREDDL